MDTDSRYCEAGEPRARGCLQVVVRLVYLNKISLPAFQWAVTATMLPRQGERCRRAGICRNPLTENTVRFAARNAAEHESIEVPK